MPTPTLLADGCVLVPHWPDWSIQPSPERRWETGVSEGITGAEDRESLRQIPLRSLAWTVVPYDQRENEIAHATIRAALKAARAATPWWGRSLVLGAAGVGAGDTTVPISALVPSAWLPAAGEQLWAAGPWATAGGAPWELWTVATVTPGVGGAEHTLTLTAAAARPLPGGAVAVWRLLRGQLSCEGIDWDEPTCGTYPLRIDEPLGVNPGVAESTSEVRWGLSFEGSDIDLPLDYGPGGVTANPQYVFDHLPSGELVPGITRAGGYDFHTVAGPGALTWDLPVGSVNLASYVSGGTSSIGLITLRGRTVGLGYGSIQWHSRFLACDVRVKSVIGGTGTSLRVENTTGASLTLTSTASLTSSLVIGPQTLVSASSRTEVNTVAAYDGTVDWAGPSGFTYAPFIGNFNQVHSLTPSSPGWSTVLGTYGYGGPAAFTTSITRSHTTPSVAPASFTYAPRFYVEVELKAYFNPWEGFFWFACRSAGPQPGAGGVHDRLTGLAWPLAAESELTASGFIGGGGEVNGWGYYNVWTDPGSVGLTPADYRLFRSKFPIWGGDDVNLDILP